jgi:hypothetical protein
LDFLQRRRGHGSSAALPALACAALLWLAPAALAASDVSITLAEPTSALPLYGDTPLALTVANAGPDPAPEVRVVASGSRRLGVTIVASSCSPGDPEECAFGTLEPGEEVDASLVVRPLALAPLRARVTVSHAGAETDPADDSAAVDIRTEAVPGACANRRAGFEQRNIFLGTRAGDALIGAALRDRLDGGDGDDCLEGQEDDDVLEAGPGDDRAEGGGGDDPISGRGGDDALEGDRGDDNVFGDGGDDTVRGGPGKDFLRGGAGGDEIDGGRGSDDIDGGRGRDTVRAGRGDDEVVMTPFGRRGRADVVDCGSGDDVATVSPRVETRDCETVNVQQPIRLPFTGPRPPAPGGGEGGGGDGGGGGRRHCNRRRKRCPRGGPRARVPVPVRPMERRPTSARP